MATTQADAKKWNGQKINTPDSKIKLANWVDGNQNGIEKARKNLIARTRGKPGGSKGVDRTPNNGSLR